jgi:hypothetical protein
VPQAALARPLLKTERRRIKWNSGLNPLVVAPSKLIKHATRVRLAFEDASGDRGTMLSELHDLDNPDPSLDKQATLKQKLSALGTNPLYISETANADSPQPGAEWLEQEQNESSGFVLIRGIEWQMAMTPFPVP